MAVIELSNVRKDYQGLRPLRLRSLTVAAGERVAVAGVDAGAAEVLINLVTGAALPDEGEVRIFGRSTSEISGGDEWLVSLESFGIVSARAVLLEGATLEQNLAMPFTLQIDPVPADVRTRVATLALECGISLGSTAFGDGDGLMRTAGEVPPDVRVRLHLARAVALDPKLLLLEHPTAGVAHAGRAALADDVARVLEGRRLTTLAITQDESFAARIAHRVLKLQPASGELSPMRRGWFRLSCV
jgi:ATP-binding cassette subfamily C protein CydCD